MSESRSFSFTHLPPLSSARPPDLHPGPSLLLSSPILFLLSLRVTASPHLPLRLVPASCVSPLFLTFAVSPSCLAIQTAADSAVLLIHSKVGQSLGQCFFFFRRQNFVLKASAVSQDITGDPPSPRPRWLSRIEKIAKKTTSKQRREIVRVDFEETLLSPHLLSLQWSISIFQVLLLLIKVSLFCRVSAEYLEFCGAPKYSKQLKKGWKRRQQVEAGTAVAQRPRRRLRLWATQN